jgi:RsiW-degrading membrane proteinase PrsW (M82 family)
LEPIKLIAIALALVPVFIWSYIFFDDARKQYKLLFAIVFLSGTLTVLPILGIQWAYFEVIFGKIGLIKSIPGADFVGALKSWAGPAAWVFIVYAFVATTEEIVKFYIVRISDNKHPELISNINQALKFGILSGLGFAFSENILYFIKAYTEQGQQGLLTTFIFRSTFTVCAHLCFTGIFSYYYGMSKFSQDFVDFKKWTGQKISVNEYQSTRNKYIFTGLSLSIILHAAFNITLELGANADPFIIAGRSVNLYLVSVILLVIGMFLFLQYLLSRKTGNLTFVLANKHRSTMAQKDKEVVLELIGMWYNEKKYTEVEGICDRLLKRDPDNNVVKLFKAKIQEKNVHPTENSNSSRLAN